MLNQLGRNLQGPPRLMLADVEDGRRLVHAFRVVHISIWGQSGQCADILSGGRKVGECCGLPRGRHSRECSAAVRDRGGWT
jgi:hypothetical protein